MLISAVGAGILSPYGNPCDHITESYTLSTECSSAAVEYLVLPVVSMTAFFKVRLAPNFTATPLDGPPIPLPSPAVLMHAVADACWQRYYMFTHQTIFGSRTHSTILSL